MFIGNETNKELTENDIQKAWNIKNNKIPLYADVKLIRI